MWKSQLQLLLAALAAENALPGDLAVFNQSNNAPLQLALFEVKTVKGQVERSTLPLENVEHVQPVEIVPEVHGVVLEW